MKKNRELQNFIHINYPQTGFLIYQMQVSMSLLLENKEVSFQSKLELINSYLIHNQQKILIFNLNMFLQKFFKVGTKNKTGLYLLVKTSHFNDKTQKVLDKFFNINRLNKLISTDFILFKIPNLVEILSLNSHDFNLAPNAVHGFISQYGIAGILFMEKKINFLIDLETVFLKYILKKFEKGNL